jgi:replicative DNA helicase
MKQDNTPSPQLIEAEESVIGTILTCPDSLNDIVSKLTPDMFYKTDLKEAYKACLNISGRHMIPDLVSVTDELRKKGLDLALYLTDLSGRIVTSQMIEQQALYIKEKYLLRRYAQLGNELNNMAYTEDLEDVVCKAETEILNISNFLHSKEPKHLKALIDGVIDITSRLISREISLIGIPSGFTDLDRVTGGFKKGELTIIAGRPSMGKTALALQIGKNASELGNPVLIFSCEMSEDELARRFLAGVSGYTNTELNSGRCNVDNLCKSSESLITYPIYIDDTSSISLIELKSKARKMILKHGIKLIIIDYLQLMSGAGKGQNREQEISNLSRGLKAIAKDLSTPVIALSQLNRQAEARAEKKPLLSDLRDSGAIEQDADICMLIYRPAYYGAGANTENLMVINLAKNRNGATGEISLTHNLSMTEIHD